MYLYWAKGIQNVSLNEICRKANIAKTSFYREFDSEDKLMELAIKMYFDWFNCLLAELNLEGKPSVEVFGMLMDLILDDRSEDIPPGCMLVKMRDVRGDKLGPKASAQLHLCQKQQMKLIEHFVICGQQHGDFTKEISIPTAVAYIDNQLCNALALMARGEPSDRIKEFSKIAFSPLFIQKT
ncbi:MAG: TetR/AcrR family transcriptional regulator [Proteobacteria bacterium]|nr:TetR/AcrR family transcriptional regulator [Pseudomonadota bacterium]MDA0856408.1 TetR/AcrR family transcriptional regulator [Pseudomonadota bacterium]